MALLTLCTMAGYATDVRPKYVSSQVDGTMATGEGAEKLVDEENGTPTKWCVTKFKSASIVVDAQKKLKVEKIKLRIGKDTPKNPARRWKNFKVWGSNDKDNQSSWEELRYFQDQNLPTVSNKYFEGYLGTSKAYRYYKVDEISVMSGDVMEMGDMLFVLDENPTVQYEEVEIRPAYHSAAFYKFPFDQFVVKTKPDNVPSRLVDNAGTATSWGPGEDAKAPQIIIVDAKQPCMLKSMKLFAPDTDAPADEKLSIAVYGTNDPIDATHGEWTKLYGIENAEWKSTEAVAFATSINSTYEYRFYKIEKLASNTVTLMSDLKFVVERQLNAPTVPKSFTPGHVFSPGQYGGDNALDGNLGTWWMSNPGAFVVVDAKQPIKLYGFELYNYNNQNGGFWKDYAIYGSNNQYERDNWVELRKFENRFPDSKPGALASLNVVNSNTEYQYYKLVFNGSTSNSNTGSLGELKLVRRNDSYANEGSVIPTPELGANYRVLDANSPHTLNANEVVIVDKDITLTGTDRYAPLEAAANGITIIEFRNDATLTLTAKKESRYPGLWIPEGSTVVLRGKGKLVAQGGSGISATAGTVGEGGAIYPEKGYDSKGGKGGNGGKGGTGAAAGIGGIAGTGGAGGNGAAAVLAQEKWTYYGKSGSDGQDGENGQPSGDLILMEEVLVSSMAGTASTQQAGGGNASGYGEDRRGGHYSKLGTSGGGGGGGGQGGMPTVTLCAGGGAGGGGGAGANSGFATSIWDIKKDFLPLLNKIYEFNQSCGRGGAGGEGSVKGHDGQSQIRKNNRYEDRDDWDDNGFKEGVYSEKNYSNTATTQKGGKMGEVGKDGIVYSLGTDKKIAELTTGLKVYDNVKENPSIADLQNLFKDKKGEKMIDLITYSLNLKPSRGAVFLNGDKKNAEMGTSITFYAGMQIPYQLKVSIPSGKGTFVGFYFANSEGYLKAFDENGMITAEFRSMIMTSPVNGVCYMKPSLRNGFNLYPVFAGEVTLTVKHFVRNYTTNKDVEVSSVTRTDTVSGSDIVDFIVRPFVTITKEGETPDTLVCKGDETIGNMRLSVTSFKTDFQPQTVTLSSSDAQRTLNILYTTRGMEYKLDESELATYGASFYGDYTQANESMHLGETIKLPKVAFKQAGTDGSYYRLAGWKSSAQEETLSEDAISYSMPASTVSVKPLFEKSALLAIATKQKDEADQRNWADSCSVLLHPDNSSYNNSTIVMAGDEKFEKIYVNVFNQTGARLDMLKAEMSVTTGSSEIRNIELVNAKDAGQEDKCYFLRPTDWTKGEGELYPVVYLTAMFTEDRKEAKVRYVGDVSQSAGTRAEAPQMPVVALSTDGRNFYYDDSAFDVLTKQEGCVKAGSLNEFDFGYEDQIGVYVNNAGNLDNISITATPDNVSLPADEASAWNLQCVSTEPMTCLKFKASTYDDVTITVKVGASPNAIEKIEAEDPSDRIIYDLDGHRVGYMRRGAIVIENGNKYIVR